LPKPLKEYVQQVLAENDRGSKIRQALDYAAVQAKKEAKGWWRRKSTRRAIFWENAVQKLIELLADDPGVQIVSHHDTVSFIFDDAVLVRLKKADMTLHTSNYPTPTAELFDVHQEDLFGYIGLQRVEAVYIPNRFDTDAIWTGIVAHDGNSDLWHFELAEPVAAPTATLPQPVQSPAADLATVKNQAKGAKKKSGDGTR
jgi:hypothetical protein